MWKKLMLTFALFGALALAAGCGGDGESETAGLSEDDEAAIATTIDRAFLEVGDAADCSELYTEASLRQQLAIPDPATDAVEACEQRYEEDPPEAADSIETSGLTGDDGAASISVESSGGDLDKVRLTLRLVADEAPTEEGAEGEDTATSDATGWKVDVIEDAEILRKRLVPDFDVESAGFGELQQVADPRCFKQYLNKEVTRREAEKAIVDPVGASYIYDSIRACVGSGSDFLTMFRVLYTQLSNEFKGQLPNSDALAACVVGFMVPDLTRLIVKQEKTLEDFARDPKAKEKLNQAAAKATEETAVACLGAPAPKGIPTPKKIPKGA